MTCNCQSPTWFGCEGFAIVQDEEFVVSEPIPFAGWKTGYGPACTCDGQCGGSQSGVERKCEKGEKCGGRTQPRLETRSDALVRMADYVESRVAFGPRQYQGGGNWEAIGREGTDNTAGGTSASWTTTVTIFDGQGSTSTTETSTFSQTASYSSTETTAGKCCCPGQLEVSPAPGNAVRNGKVSAPFSVRFTWESKDGKGGDCDLHWWEFGTSKGIPKGYDPRTYNPNGFNDGTRTNEFGQYMLNGQDGQNFSVGGVTYRGQDGIITAQKAGRSLWDYTDNVVLDPGASLTVIAVLVSGCESCSDTCVAIHVTANNPRNLSRSMTSTGVGCPSGEPFAGESPDKAYRVFLTQQWPL